MKKTLYLVSAALSALVVVVSLALMAKVHTHDTPVLLQYGTVYVTNIDRDVRFCLPKPSPNLYEGLILLVSNTTDHPVSVSFGTNIWWTTNGKSTLIMSEHVGKYEREFSTELGQ